MKFPWCKGTTFSLSTHLLMIKSGEVLTGERLVCPLVPESPTPSTQPTGLVYLANSRPTNTSVLKKKEQERLLMKIIPEDNFWLLHTCIFTHENLYEL